MENKEKELKKAPENKEIVNKPLDFTLEIGNIEKEQVDTIIKEYRKYNCKAFKKGDIMRLEFPLEDANKIDFEDFINNLSDYTGRVVHINMRDGKLNMRFGEERKVK